MFSLRYHIFCQIMYETIIFNPNKYEEKPEEHLPQNFKKSFVKITLRKSEFFKIFNQISTTVAKGTPQGIKWRQIIGNMTI